MFYVWTFSFVYLFYLLLFIFLFFVLFILCTYFFYFLRAFLFVLLFHFFFIYLFICLWLFYILFFALFILFYFFRRCDAGEAQAEVRWGYPSCRGLRALPLLGAAPGGSLPSPPVAFHCCFLQGFLVLMFVQYVGEHMVLEGPSTSYFCCMSIKRAKQKKNQRDRYFLWFVYFFDWYTVY